MAIIDDPYVPRATPGPSVASGSTAHSSIDEAAVLGHRSPFAASWQPTPLNQPMAPEYCVSWDPDKPALTVTSDKTYLEFPSTMPIFPSTGVGTSMVAMVAYPCQHCRTDLGYASLGSIRKCPCGKWSAFVVQAGSLPTAGSLLHSDKYWGTGTSFSVGRWAPLEDPME